ncbi:hypothetical protein [Xanthomonas graminis]|uniref:hypothetical protein n=1 Tax=Xanthomonas graminis TaxID=3390026 RepID=UPI001F2170AA|nr:hypothetical protein [Xanthomonas translucens]UKE74789.1 hypothetical protein KFS85_07875 [Xanthomonas translucens pv. phleipratensis]
MDMPDRTLPFFRTPADQGTRDLQHNPALSTKLGALWSDYLNGITEQTIVGNPWQQSYSANTPYYYNPLTTPIPRSAQATNINWSAMPGRIAYYNGADWKSQLSATQINQLADFGWQPDAADPHRQSFPDLVTDPCSGEPAAKKYGPYGPRGWQDEYCEWSVLRDLQSNKIVRIDFTCENPEYWYALWRVAPEVVLELYQSTLDNQTITAEDLWLKDGSGSPVIDPSTGQPAYNPLNIWNCGPVRTATAGGAMHLTSTPNTLQTEIAGLAGAATIQRNGHPTDPEKLLCCAQFGQPYRNSDPNIGLIVNLVVGKNNKVTISDPPGLYMQMPVFSQYTLPANAPAGAKPQDYWTVTRGALTLNDMYGNPLPGNLILHAVFEVPADQGFSVGDMQIGGVPIDYAAQVAATFFMQINATPIPIDGPLQSEPCVGTPAMPTPQPLQIFHSALWQAYYDTPAPANPVGAPMVLASNTVILPPTVSPGQSEVLLTLVCTGASLGPQGQLPTVSFGGAPGSIVATVLSLENEIVYTVPGNSYPSSNQALALRVDVAANAARGLVAVSITNFGQETPQAAPSFLRIDV